MKQFFPLAFRYLADVSAPPWAFTTFSVPTAVTVKAPGFFAPLQGRAWRVTPARANFFLNSDIVANDGCYIIEAWVNRSSTDFPAYELLGYAVIKSYQFDEVVADGCLAVDIVTAARPISG